MDNLELISPTSVLRQSYETYIKEIEGLSERPTPFVLASSYDSFEDLIIELENCSKSIGLEEGWAPHSTYWLVEHKTEIVGVSNIRHSLTENLLDRGGHIGYGIRPSRRKEGFGKVILKESLIKAKGLGVNKALLTCAIDNLGSNKIIQANGGILEKTSMSELAQELTNYYWIEN